MHSQPGSSVILFFLEFVPKMFTELQDAHKIMFSEIFNFMIWIETVK